MAAHQGHGRNLPLLGRYKFEEGVKDLRKAERLVQVDVLQYYPSWDRK
jgi:hypothetical protein